MIMISVLVISILIQIIAACLALRLIWITGRGRAWILIAVAISLMSFRRCISLIGILSGETTYLADLTAELIAAATSALMLAGVAWIAPVFMSIKDSEKRAIERKEVLKNILSASPVGISLIENNRINFANDTLLEMFGFEHEKDYLNKKPSIVYATKEGYKRVGRELYDRLKHSEPAGTDAEFKRKDDSIFDGHVRISCSYPSNPMKKAVAVISDISWRKQAETALAEEKERLAVTLRSIGDGVICTDTAGTVVLMNRAAEELTGWPEKEAASKPLNKVFHIINENTRKECENPVTKVMKTGKIIGLANHTALVARDGRERVIADSGAPIRDAGKNIIGVVLVFRDITEKQKMEQELLKLDKLKSIGILAGGIAHDFNNLLMAILGNISIAKLAADPGGKIFERLTEAEKASLRARDLTRQLLTFSKGGAPVKKTILIMELIKESTGFALKGSNVRCKFQIDDDLWPVEADEGQISQVINNLVINADQAMPDGGIIKIQADNIIAGAKDILALKEGKYVKISIKDEGIGISKKYLTKIFDPYFSTKQKGSGLGLASAFSIITNHDGHIAVESEPKTGTVFNIYLPASFKDVAATKKDKKMPAMGRGKILVMDDEEIVREVMGEMLKAIGYESELARDGTEAIELYKKAGDAGKEFDAVIFDLTVPGGMGGREAAEKLIEINPEVRIIVSSGYSGDPVMAEFKKYGFSGVLVKPYKIKELSKVLQHLI